MDCDTFINIDQMIVKWILERLIAEDTGAKLDRFDIPEICDKRMKMHFGRKTEKTYQLLNSAFHLIEAAIKEEDMMELQMPTADGKSFFNLIGKPLSVSKQPGEAVMRIQIEPTKEIENMLVSRITHLRRLRF